MWALAPEMHLEKRAHSLAIPDSRTPVGSISRTASAVACRPHQRHLRKKPGEYRMRAQPIRVSQGRALNVTGSHMIQAGGLAVHRRLDLAQRGSA